MTDRQLVQLICAFRLFNSKVELSLSTRESPMFRDQVAKLGITSMSAASKTQPGGYSDPKVELEQFAVSDERSAAEVSSALMEQGLQVVWHDWHRAIQANVSLKLMFHVKPKACILQKRHLRFG